MSVDLDAFLDPSTVPERAERARETAAQAGADQAGTLDVAAYLDPGHFAAELEVFRSSWHIAATSAELAEPGCFVRWDFLGRPVIVTRANDGGLHGFYDVCLHRGGPVAPSQCGEARRFVCPYHSWTYDLTGRLVGVPSAEHFPDLTIEDESLAKVSVAEDGGLVWVSEAPATDDLGAWLGSVGEAIRWGRLDDYSLESHQRYEVASNWKISTEAGIDTYHIDHLHRRTARGVLDNAGTLVERDGPHSTTVVPLVRPELANAYLARDVSAETPGNVQCWIFPTHQVSLFPYAIAVISHYPGAIDTTLVDWRILVHHEVTAPDARAEIVRNYEATFAEDRVLSPKIQANLETGVIDRVRLSVKEDRIRHLHDAMAEAIERRS